MYDSEYDSDQVDGQDDVCDAVAGAAPDELLETQREGTQVATRRASSPVAPRSPFPSSVSATTANRWLRILHRITEGAAAHLDLGELLRELLGRIRDAMGVDNTAILLVSDDGTSLNLYAARGPEEDVTGMVRIPMGRGVAGSIAASAQPRIIEDLSQVEVENPLLRATVHSLLGVPLFVGARVIGVLHVDSARARHFTDEDLQLLQVIGGRVALAIEVAQLFEAERAARQEAETARREAEAARQEAEKARQIAEAAMRRLEALQAVSDVALENARLSDLLHALLPRIQQMLGVDNVAILLPTPDGTELTLYSVHGPEEAVMGKVHVPMGEGVAGTIAARREPLFVENLKAVPVANPFLREHFCSLLGVPLIDNGRLIGVIHVDSIAERHFNEDESRLLQVMAERIARAIAHAQHYERVQQSRTQAEREVAALQETTERMDEFLSIASHELRTPLTSLSMNLQMADYWLILERGKRLEESTAEYSERAVTAVRPLLVRSFESTKRLDRLVGDLLDASRIRENRLELKPSPIDLVALVDDVVVEFQQAHPGRSVRRQMSDDEEPVALVLDVDADRIRQVLSNYLSNALKYSRGDRPVVVTLAQESDQVRVSVRDEGIGIPSDELEHIWTRFYRVGGVSHQSGSQVGLGLGLYISRDIIERQGGQVGAESRLGEGSTFWFTLPLSPPKAAAGSTNGH